MLCHIIPGVKGCRFGREYSLGVIIVDALRASATSAMLLHFGVTEILVVKEIDTALRLRNVFSDILLYGERNGLPPKGFDYGNSPSEAIHARGKRVVFTTTTGATLLFEAYPAGFVIMGTTVNLKSVCNFVKNQNLDVVIVPAGLYDDPTFPAEEDWATSVLIAKALDCEICSGYEEFLFWKNILESEGLENIFKTSTHAQKLIKINLFSDVLYSAQLNITNSIPIVVEKKEDYLILKDANNFN